MPRIFFKMNVPPASLTFVLLTYVASVLSFSGQALICPTPATVVPEHVRDWLPVYKKLLEAVRLMLDQTSTGKQWCVWPQISTTLHLFRHFICCQNIKRGLCWKTVKLGDDFYGVFFFPLFVYTWWCDLGTKNMPWLFGLCSRDAVSVVFRLPIVYVL